MEKSYIRFSLLALLYLGIVPATTVAAQTNVASTTYYVLSQRITGLEAGKAFDRKASLAFKIYRRNAQTTSNYDVSVTAVNVLATPGVYLAAGVADPKPIVHLSRDSSTERIEAVFPSPLVAYANELVKGLASLPMSTGTDASTVESPKDERLRRFFDGTLRFSYTVTPFQLENKSFVLIQFSTDRFYQPLPSGGRAEERCSGVAVIDGAKTAVYLMATRFGGVRELGNSRDSFSAVSLLVDSTRDQLGLIEPLDRSDIVRAALDSWEQDAAVEAHGSPDGQLPVWAGEVKTRPTEMLSPR